MLPEKNRQNIANALSRWSRNPFKEKRKQASPEKDIQNAIMQYLRAKKIFCYRNNTGAVKTDHGFYSYGSVGSPDVICVVNGIFIGIEVKSSTGRQSAMQKRWQEALEEAGGTYILARSVDDVISKL